MLNCALHDHSQTVFAPGRDTSLSLSIHTFFHWLKTNSARKWSAFCPPRHPPIRFGSIFFSEETVQPRPACTNLTTLKDYHDKLSDSFNFSTLEVLALGFHTLIVRISISPSHAPDFLSPRHLYPTASDPVELVDKIASDLTRSSGSHPTKNQKSAHKRCGP